MKICIILPDLRGGGAEKVCINLAKEWIKQKHNVSFILMEKKGELLKEVPSEINIVDLKKKKIRNLFFPLFKLFFKEKYDVICVNMWPLTSVAVFSWLLSFKKGRLFVVDHVHLETSVLKELKKSYLIFKIILGFTYLFPDKIITVSKGVKKNLLQINKNLKKKIRVIYNPVVSKEEIFAKITNKSLIVKKIWGKKSFYKILAVGSLKEQKNYFNLITAFSKINKIKNAKLIIVGNGKQEKKLKKYCKNLKLEKKIIFAGFQRDLKPYYQTTDIFVSSSSWEGFSNVIAEAIGYGITVVATNCKSGPAEILKNGKLGYLVPVDNAIALSKAINTAYKNKINKKKLIKRSLDFEISKIAKKYINIFND